MTSACSGNAWHARVLEGGHEVEAVGVRAVEVDAHGGGAVEAGGQGERLAEAAVLAGAGDEDPLALHPGVERLGEAELLPVDRERHDAPRLAGTGIALVTGR